MIPKIPKIIHQTWKSPDAPNEHLARCMHSFKMQSGWAYRLANDEIMAKDVASTGNLAWIRAYGESEKMIHKADIWRLVALWKWGGCYADIDMWMIRPLDDLVQSLGIQPDAHNKFYWVADHKIHSAMLYGGRRMVMNNFMLTGMKNRFVKTCLDRIAKNSQIRPISGDPVQSTGPGLLTEEATAYGFADSVLSEMPTDSIHPLPDMTLTSMNGPLYSSYVKMIENGEWRKRFNPFAAHLWFHCYHSSNNMIEMFGEKLFQ